MGEQLAKTDVAELTTRIAAAYVSFHQLPVPDVARVIHAIGSELAALGTEAEPTVPQKPAPVVAVRRSVRPDHLVCLICGKRQTLLKRHLVLEHELTATQYREAFGLGPEYPMTAPDQARQRRELALRVGLGRLKQPAPRCRNSWPRAPERNASSLAAGES